MKQYNYNGNSPLSFTWKEKDYVVFGEGPHELPSDCDHVESLVAQKILIPLKKVTKTNS